MTVLLPLIVIVVGLVLPLRSPLQLVKLQPVCADGRQLYHVAIMVCSLVRALGHRAAASVLTVNVYSSKRVNVAVTVLLLSMVTTQAPLPLQAPLQLVKA